MNEDNLNNKNLHYDLMLFLLIILICFSLQDNADDEQIRVETCGLNRSDEAASTAADDDQIRVETCTDPCGLNRSDEAASTAADDDQINANYLFHQ